MWKAPTFRSSPEPLPHAPLQLPTAKPPLPGLLPLLRLQPCHLARNQVRFGLRQAAQCVGPATNASGERSPGQAAASEPLQAPPGLAGIGQRPAGSPRPPWVLLSPEAIWADRARELASDWP